MVYQTGPNLFLPKGHYWPNLFLPKGHYWEDPQVTIGFESSNGLIPWMV